VARDDSRVIGFVYGYRSEPGTYWHDLASSRLEPVARRHWLHDCFEFVELAVLPAFQGRGVGGALHDAILEDLAFRTTCLTTYREQETAVRLYLKRGWEVLADDFLFPGDPFPYLLMGRELAS
jgi:GNAT superfamily N-acetyltransferase